MALYFGVGHHVEALVVDNGSTPKKWLVKQTFPFILFIAFSVTSTKFGAMLYSWRESILVHHLVFSGPPLGNNVFLMFKKEKIVASHANLCFDLENGVPKVWLAFIEAHQDFSTETSFLACGYCML